MRAAGIYRSELAALPAQSHSRTLLPSHGYAARSAGQGSSGRHQGIETVSY